MQMRIKVVKFLLVYCKTGVFTYYLINFPQSVVIFTRVVDTEVNPIQL